MTWLILLSVYWLWAGLYCSKAPLRRGFANNIADFIFCMVVGGFVVAVGTYRGLRRNWRRRYGR